MGKTRYIFVFFLIIFIVLTFSMPYTQFYKPHFYDSHERTIINKDRFYSFIDLAFFKEQLENIDERITTTIIRNHFEIGFYEMSPQMVETILFNHRPLYQIQSSDLFSEIDITVDPNITVKVPIHKINNKDYIYLPNEMIFSVISAK